jgi:endonuclease YncB( thermonuclease family)
VADIHCGDKDLAEDLIKAGLARAYDGGKKEVVGSIPSSSTRKFKGLRLTPRALSFFSTTLLA